MAQKQFQKRFGGKIKGKWLILDGNLECFNNQLTSLPDNLKVDGGLYPFSDIVWNDIKMVNQVLSGSLSAQEVFAIKNTEHRRIAYERMDKLKIKELPNLKVLDEVKDDGYGYPMKIVSFDLPDYNTPLYFLNVCCSSTGREYFIETRQKTCEKAKSRSFGLEEIEFEKEW